MVINDLYRMEDKQVETLFSFDEEVLKKALKNIYSKDFHPLTENNKRGSGQGVWDTKARRSGL